MSAISEQSECLEAPTAAALSGRAGALLSCQWCVLELRPASSAPLALCGARAAALTGSSIVTCMRWEQ
jgi:hypothetical protein